MRTDKAANKTFTDLGVNGAISAYLQGLSITGPTTIQEASYPLIADGKSFLGMSETGSGKTFSYLLPLTARFDPQRHTGLFTLILVPSAELAHQTVKDIRDLQKAGARYTYSVMALLAEGNRIRQIDELRKTHPNFIVGTPGTVRKYIEDKKLHIQNPTLKSAEASLTQALVLDEADELSSRSFRDDCLFIRSKFLKDAQIIGMSATLNKRAESFFEQLCRHSFTEVRDCSIHIPDTVTNLLVQTTLRERFETVRQVINTFKKDDRIVIFTANSYEIKQIFDKLNRRGYRASFIDGRSDKQAVRAQRQRFDDGNTNIMITTDALGRGLNLGNITAVIQYRLPEDVRTFVNRAGRTGRNGQHGINIAICEPGGSKKAEHFAELASITLQSVQPNGGRLMSVADNADNEQMTDDHKPNDHKGQTHKKYADRSAKKNKHKNRKRKKNNYKELRP